jgi:hypothetical protein
VKGAVNPNVVLHFNEFSVIFKVLNKYGSKKGEGSLKVVKKYFWLHLIHALFICILLLSGSFLYSDLLRAWISNIKWDLRQAHAVIGILYFIFVVAIIPTIVPYTRIKRTWQKTFHICLLVLCMIGWSLSGLYLWVNPTGSFGVRQFALDIHDALSLFIVPWVCGHILLWLFKKYRWIKPQKKKQGTAVQGELISRREVVIFFGGIFASFLLGGIFRWYRPISSTFLARLGEAKRRGYFRIYSVRTDSPIFDPKTWKLTITGLVNQPLELTFQELMALPKNTYVHDFHCVTGWSVMGVKWEGIPFAELVSRAKAQGPYVKIYSSDLIYTETYELAQLMNKNVLLVYQLDDKPLLVSQGAPLRLFHPDMYGYKSIKWVSKIEFTDKREPGYWEEKEGYNLNGYIT